MKRLKGSYTIEAAVLIPMILFIMMTVLLMGIQFYEKCLYREKNKRLEELDILSEFYMYQVLEEVGDEIQ